MIQLAQNSAPVAAIESDSNQDNLLEILRRKQAQLDAQGAVKKPEPVLAPAAKPVPAPKPSVKEIQPPQSQINVSKPTVVVSQPAPAPEAQDQLVEILRKKQVELDARQGATVTPQKTPPVQTPRPVEATKPATSESAAAKEREKRIREIEAEIKAKEEAFRKAAAKPQPVSPPKKEEAIKATAEAKKETKSQNYKAPIVESGSKEARLAELLRKYRADEITPHDYHLERAKIIAEP